MSIKLPVQEGFYIPSITNATNLDGTSALNIYYQVVGKVITIHGYMNIDAAASGVVSFRFGMPAGITLDETNDRVCGTFSAGSDLMYSTHYLAGSNYVDVQGNPSSRTNTTVVVFIRAKIL
jgi:hypothetical protein